MRMWLVLIILLLAACNTAGPQFRGLPATQVTVDGSTFDVRVRDNTAEAIRVNVEYASRFGPIRERARIAMEQVSGCDVVKVGGDQAQATGVLKCGKSRPHPIPKPGTLECIPVRGTTLRGVGQATVEVDCYPT